METTQKLVDFYEVMRRIRLFEEATADLQEAGEIKTPCHFCIGQEAVAAGVCGVLKTTDVIWGAHRSHGHYLAKGGSTRKLMAEIFCKATGCSGGRGGSMHVCAPEVGVLGTVPIVAGTIPIAVGAGLAASLDGSGRVSVSFFGDGATEEGHFFESLNLASIKKLPVIFVCENNFYSSHMALAERRVKDDIPSFGESHGIPSFRLDGNDVQAVAQATTDAVERARSGEGPTLLECRTFRWRGHVGPAWDMDVGVKRKDELQEWLKRDPIALHASVLRNQGVNESVLKQIDAALDNEISEAIDFARNSPSPEKASVLNHTYKAA